MSVTMDISGSVLINFLPDGSIVKEGEHSPAISESILAPFGALGVSVVRASLGDYRVSAPGAAWLDGYKVTIFRNENDENTVHVTLSTDDEGRLRIQCVHPETREPMDIIYMMTVRIGVSGVIAYQPPAVSAGDSSAPLIGLPEALS